jgi:branched-subunit amino acid aminotransferase/4-amino-4-deoxychorismate lyase
VAVNETLFQFHAGSLIPVSDDFIDSSLATADSWLVEDGRARSLEKHFDRFSKSVKHLAGFEPTEFVEAVKIALPRTERWNPRIELQFLPEPTLLLRLRTAEAELADLVLWTSPEADPRENPQIKGPDLSYGMQLRRAAQMHGADEAVILNDQGFIVEGALSSIVWWRDDVLCAPSEEIPWLPSVTRAEVFAIAEQMGLGTRVELVKPADLVGLEVWSLGSLHGIRPATSWVDLGGPLGLHRHVEAFNKRMRILSTAIA